MRRMTLPGRDVGWREFLHRLRTEVKHDNLGAVAGSVTFASLLSLFPFLIFLVALAGVLIDPARIQHLVAQLAPVMPPEGVKLVEDYLTNLTQASGGGLLTFGALGALFTASRGVKAFIHALNVAYSFEERRPGWKLQLVASATVLCSAVGLVIMLGTVVVLPAVAERLHLPLLEVLSWLRLPVAGLLLLLAWAAYDSLLPAERRAYRPFTFGNLVGLVGWLAVSWGFSVYVQGFGRFNATYGALGGVIVLLLWMNLSVQVFLLAAEINGLLDRMEAGVSDAPPDCAKPGETSRGSAAQHPGRVSPRAPSGHS